MSSQIKIHCPEYTPNKEHFADHTFRNTDMLPRRMAQLEQQLHHYQQKYQQMVSINHSIIEAIKRVFSPQIGEQLELIVEQQQNQFGATPHKNYHVGLTDTFCQKMLSCTSKLRSEQSLDQLPRRFITPQKDHTQFPPSSMPHSQKRELSPFLLNNNSRKCQMGDSSFKVDSAEVSTRRSSTPVKTHIATNIYCELCEKVFPPNQFVSHTQICKYQLQDPGWQTANRGESSMHISGANYDKMMRNLLKIREQIQLQINLLSSTREQVDRNSLKRKLEQDLQRVIQVIQQKEKEINQKKRCNVPSSNPKLHHKKSKIK